MQADLDFDTDDRTLAGTVALGYRSGENVAAGVLGHNTRVELASNFFSSDDSDTRYPAAPNGFPDGFLLGMYFSDRGMEGVAVLGGPDFLGNTEVPEVRQSAKFDVADFNLSLAADHSNGHEDIVVSPRVGVAYAFFNQAYDLYSETPDSLAPALVGGKFYYSTDEQLETQYAGLSIGIDGRFQLGKGFSLMAGGTFMPLYAHTQMDLDYRGKAWPGVPFATEVNESDDEFTFRAMGDIELTCQVGQASVSLGATVDYWEAVPVVSYPEFQAGGFNAITNLAPQAPDIDYDDMVTVQVMLKMAVAF